MTMVRPMMECSPVRLIMESVMSTYEQGDDMCSCSRTNLGDAARGLNIAQISGVPRALTKVTDKR